MYSKLTKRISSILILLILSISIVMQNGGGHVFADELIGPVEKRPLEVRENLTEELFQEGSFTGNVEADAIADENLEKHLKDNMRMFQSEISLTGYSLPREEFSSFWKSFINTNPDLFYLSGSVSYSIVNNMVVKIYPGYRYTKAEGERRITEFENEVEKVRGIVKPGMSDLETALIVHDYLVNQISYDYDNYLAGTIPGDSYTAYGALVLDKAVCNGYGLAYLHLMKNVFDIPTLYVVSAEMNHGWNMVMIDGVYYHVDATWDDPVPDQLGYTGHDHFLVSDRRITELNHRGWSSPVSAPSTKYDNYFWKDVRTSFSMILDEYYYVSQDQKIRAWSPENNTTRDIRTITSSWRAQNGGYYAGAFQKLQTARGRLFYSQPDGIYSVDRNGSDLRKEYGADPTKGNIYGFRLSGSQMEYVQSFDPRLSGKEQVIRVELSRGPGVTGVAFRESRYELNTGETMDLVLDFTPLNAENKDYVVEIQNPAVVGFENGRLTGREIGSTEILIRTVDGDHRARTTVTVTEAYTSIEIGSVPTNTTYYTGDLLDLSGLEVYGILPDGSRKVISVTMEQISGFDSSAPVENQVVYVHVGGKTAAFTVNILQRQEAGLLYRTHVQSIGWQDFVSEGEMSGTEGRALRLEAIEITANGVSDLGIRYSTHIERIGWQDYVSDGALSGTEGRKLRLEAIKMELTGEESSQYDLYYRVHAEKFGWMDWAKNGSAAGTAGFGYRLEAIEIRLVEKGTNPDLSVEASYRSKTDPKDILYRTHVQSVGWQDFVSDGEMSGTEGRRLRLEGIEILLGNHLPTGSVEYSTHVQKLGWLDPVKDGAMSGTEGQALRLEAIRISLSGVVSNHYDIYYRVHAEKVGWMGWAKNGEDAGTAGFAYRLEGIEIRLVEKGGPAPGSTSDHFRVK
ncbi:bacterial Ig-like domain-containing protein [Proteiniclasticum sp. C24MP]|uniref:bacterial Ig-like domain-containing protein n=1 Tax=Proteiniclasticum sp. C24MP TaxID=3374101 RepID=UPI003754B599